MKTSDANSLFGEYVSSQAFVLSLSRPMIAALVGYARNEGSTELMSSNALERRGLIERRWVHGVNGRRIFKIYITEAGKLVYQLLVLADLAGEQSRRKVG
jgi:hypothetical protein